MVVIWWLQYGLRWEIRIRNVNQFQECFSLLLAVLKQEAVVAPCCPFQKRPQNSKITHQN
jgi:hypothetical protein